MDTLEVTTILNEFASLPRAFPMQELIDVATSGTEEKLLEEALHSDSRFLACDMHSNVHSPFPHGREQSPETFFVSRRTLLRRFIRLNLELHKAEITEITAHQLAESVSMLRLNGQWDLPPGPVVDFGKRFGLIAASLKPNQFIFPLVYLFSCLPKVQSRMASSELAGLGAEISPHRWLRKPMQYWIREGLEQFDARTASIVERREGLRGESPATLDAIGSDQGCSRERIRQIEAKFWKRVSERLTLQRPFIRGLVFEIMRREGRTVLDSIIGPMCFVAKCSMLPFVELPHNGYIVLGAQHDDIASLLPLIYEGKETQLLNELSRLAEEGRICLSDSDFATFVERAENLQPKSQRKITRVCQILREIGKPAHYSEIAERYNERFPYDQSTENAIRAILSREKHGIVWIGVKGTFALKEWGYERPTQTLFQSVAEIVEKVYARTGKPVPFRVISAEIGRYRKLVNPSSLAIAAQFNPKLSSIGDSFFPKSERDHTADEEEYSPGKLDEILDEFRNASSSKVETRGSRLRG